MSEEDLKRMADLLRSGATMLGEHCPVCNSPLFRVKGEVWCPKCNRRVIEAKEGKELPLVASQSLDNLKATILQKIQETTKKITEEKDIDKLERLSSLLINWLEALERTVKVQKA
jgi:UPF0148 protein